MLRTIRFVTSVGLIGAALSVAAIAPAHAVDKVVYIIPGVTDSGDAANTGVATSFHCTNLTNASMDLTIRVRNFNGLMLANAKVPVAAKNTWTMSTHNTLLFAEDSVLTTGIVAQGNAIIISSRPAGVVCSAMIVDAAASVPNGIALHLQRRTPLNNTQE